MVLLFADVNGIKISYIIEGKGFPTILIHGIGDKKEIWIAQLNALSEHFTVISFDNRGAGKSDRPNIPYTMEMYADDIKGLMDHLKVKKANIVGWSLGGMIAQYFALNYPENLHKLVLINTDYKGTLGEIITESLTEASELRAQDPYKAFWHTVPFEFHTKFRKAMKAEPKKKFFGFWSVEDIVQMYSIDPPTPNDIKNAGNAFKYHNTLPQLNKIKNETLILTASHDRITPKSNMLTIHENLPNSIFKVIEKAGHNSILSRAPEVNQIIIEFLTD